MRCSFFLLYPQVVDFCFFFGGEGGNTFPDAEEKPVVIEYATHIEPTLVETQLFSVLTLLRVEPDLISYEHYKDSRTTIKPGLNHELIFFLLISLLK